MFDGYEKAYKEVIPAARAALIQELKTRYNIKEEAMSEYLEMTQAAISKYINGKYSDRVKKIHEMVDKQIVEAYAKKIVEGNHTLTNKYLCTICSKMNGFNCRFSTAEK